MKRRGYIWNSGSGGEVSSTTHPTTKNWQLALTVQKLQLEYQMSVLVGANIMKSTISPFDVQSSYFIPPNLYIQKYQNAHTLA